MISEQDKTEDGQKTQISAPSEGVIESDEGGREMMVCDDVKSIAVVKYSSIDLPAHFTQLQRNFNLNETPPNWLQGDSKWENYLREVSLSKDKPFASFKMAHCYPDLAGEIDVISDSANIKKLLKMPYSKSQVSMMVHRVGNTLLLDEFDIHKHLLRTQQDDWKWLRQFYYDTILQNMQEENKGNVVLKKNKSRDFLQSRNMFSKFLYHSGAGNEDVEESFPSGKATRPNSLLNSLGTIPDPLQQPRPDQTEHQRTLQWTFEDMHMLIGTDLPIFGGGTHPCVSLRLRDMSKPINILTGLDYWLDNLMCNVPEIAMCYHLNGIVQKYELLKTDDIPSMKACGFSTNVVKDVAQNVLSFLRSNATQEGHTYWLFKGHNDDVVKLYDLSTECTEVTEDKNTNPFTVPVGILCYRVARNMRQNSGRKKSGTIRTLMKNALTLLDPAIHSQVVTSAHYFLSDLYISDDIFDPGLNFSSDESDGEDDQEQNAADGREEDEEDESEEEVSERECSVAVQMLCQHSTKSVQQQQQLARYPPVSGILEERCREALKHIAQGLQCLDQNAREHANTDKHKVEEQAKCDPDKVIPLDYAPISPSKGDTRTKSGRLSPSQLSVFTASSASYASWHKLSKTLLLRKAAVAYHGMAESKMATQKYGQVLKYVKLGLMCYAAVRKLNPSKANDNEHIHSGLLGLSGDAHLMLVHQFDSLDAHKHDMEYQLDEDNAIIDSVLLDVKDFEFDWVCEFSADTQHNLNKSVLSYEVALEIARRVHTPPQHLTSLNKRYGNVQNELGVYYMNKAAQSLKEEQKSREPNKQMLDLIHHSFRCFELGINAFESLGDIINQALLMSNRGRLMRLMAQGHAGYLDTGQREFSSQERHHFNKAIDSYLEALRILERREACTEIWDSIWWELSSTYFTMATLLQDYAPLSSSAQEQIEKDVTDLMMKALKYCDCVTQSSPRLPTCQYRAATIHHRLASLYHNSYRNQLNEQKRKHLRTLADLHYGKACGFFTLLESPCELLRILLERFAMAEYHLSLQASPSSRLKTLQMALTYILECEAPLRMICKQLAEGGDADELQGYLEEMTKLTPILESRIQFTLMNLVKNATSLKKSKAGTGNQMVLFKKMYATLLKRMDKDLESKDLSTRCHHLLTTLEIVHEQFKENEKSE